ncbi:hypothetical protein GCM10027277_26770 [Pseudoduganella ginsengisoli]
MLPQQSMVEAMAAEAAASKAAAAEHLINVFFMMCPYEVIEMG